MAERLTEVVSSNIAKVGMTNMGLLVEYRSGARYLYKGVTKETFRKLLEAESIGKFVNSEIKGKYEYKKL